MPPVEEWLDEFHVHQVRAAEIGIVQNEDVAFLEVLGAVDYGARRELHRTHEDRQAQFALRDELAG